jgi:hypothetical protein
MCLKSEDLGGVKTEILGVFGASDHRVTRRHFVCGLNVVPPFDTQFLHLRVQCGSFQTEALSGAVGAADHSPALPEDSKYVFPFRCFEVCIHRLGGFFDGFELGEWCAQHGSR